MTDSQIADIYGNASQAGSSSRARDEVDLIDIVAFFWRFRALIGVMIVFGVFSATALWFVKRPPASAQQRAAGYWTAHLSSLQDDQLGIAALPEVVGTLNSFLKTPAGAHAFYEGVMRTYGRDLPIKEWIAQDTSGHGMLKNLEVNASSVILTFRNRGLWTEDEMLEIIPAGINNAIQSFNKSFAEAQSGLFENIVDVQLKMASVKMRALQLFDQYGSLSSSTQGAVQRKLVEQLVNSNKPEVIIFMLAGIPDTIPQKKEVIFEYRKHYFAHEALEKQSRSLAKKLGVDSIFPLPHLGSVTELNSLGDLSASDRSDLLKSLPVFLAIGLVLGGVAGVVLALIYNFWASNRQRIHEALR